MNPPALTSSMTAPRAQNRPSVSRRLSIAGSSAELGEGDPAPTGAEHKIDEEIEEIKRYEV